MLDLKFVLDNPDLVQKNADIKGDECDIARIVELGGQRKTLKQQQEAKQAELNRVNKALGPVLGLLKGKKRDEPKLAAALEKVGEITEFPELGDLPKLVKDGADALQAAMRGAGDTVKQLDPKIDALTEEIDDAMARVPNMADETAPQGATEEDNQFVSTHGKEPITDFRPKPHWDIGEALGVWHPDTAAKLTGSGFYLTTGDLCRLEWALLSYFLDSAAVRGGYTPVMCPYVANDDVMYGTGQLPKMADDMYKLDDRDRFYLIPTAEAPLTSLHAGEILDADDLPRCYTAYTPCFRREAGAAGKDTRGLLRVHQFNKVELFKLVHPDTWREEHQGLLNDATRLLDELGLHYRILELCRGELSFAATKCWDLEVHAPGIGQWLEVSSVSHFGDFQARRCNIRFREDKSKPRFCHTINGSALATPRTLVGILETYQQADGSVIVPEVLKPYLGGQEVIEPLKKG